MLGGHMAKSHQLWGEQGLARPQLHLRLGRSCLSPGPSGCPSASIKAPTEFKNGNSTMPGEKKIH